MAHPTKKTNPGMHPADVLASLKKVGQSYAKIALHFEISQTSVQHIAKGRQKSYRVANYIAQLIDKPMNEIWPDTYDYEPRPSFKERCERSAA